MREPQEMVCVGGPLAYQTLTTSADVVEVAEASGMAYFRTRPTDTNWRGLYDPDWWMKGADGPWPPPPYWEPKLPPDFVLEWHECGWQSPEVAAISDALVNGC